VTEPAALTETTVRYLYATTWLPCDDKQHTVAVPGGAATAIDAAGSLLHIALWSLRRDGLIEFEQLRPVEDERVRVLGGRPFSRYELRGTAAGERAGLEGALLRAAASVEPGGRDVRSLVRALDLDNRSPWDTVCGHCFSEAAAAGLVESKGRLFRKVVFTDMAAVESLRERHDELRAARGEYMDAEPELSQAVAADCLRTVVDAHSPDLGD
jgi:hypothetical protein